MRQLQSAFKSVNMEGLSVNMADGRLREAGHRKDIEAHVRNGHAAKANHLVKRLHASICKEIETGALGPAASISKITGKEAPIVTVTPPPISKRALKRQKKNQTNEGSRMAARQAHAAFSGTLKKF